MKGEYRECKHGFHHPPWPHSCDGCWGCDVPEAYQRPRPEGGVTHVGRHHEDENDEKEWSMKPEKLAKIRGRREDTRRKRAIKDRGLLLDYVNELQDEIQLLQRYGKTSDQLAQEAEQGYDGVARITVHERRPG